MGNTRKKSRQLSGPESDDKMLEGRVERYYLIRGASCVTLAFTAIIRHWPYSQPQSQTTRDH